MPGAIVVVTALARTYVLRRAATMDMDTGMDMSIGTGASMNKGMGRTDTMLGLELRPRIATFDS